MMEVALAALAGGPSGHADVFPVSEFDVLVRLALLLSVPSLTLLTSLSSFHPPCPCHPLPVDAARLLAYLESAHSRLP